MMYCLPMLISFLLCVVFNCVFASSNEQQSVQLQRTTQIKHYDLPSWLSSSQVDIIREIESSGATPMDIVDKVASFLDALSKSDTDKWKRVYAKCIADSLQVCDQERNDVLKSIKLFIKRRAPRDFSASELKRCHYRIADSERRKAPIFQGECGKAYEMESASSEYRRLKVELEHLTFSQMEVLTNMKRRGSALTQTETKFLFDNDKGEQKMINDALDFFSTLPRTVQNEILAQQFIRHGFMAVTIEKNFNNGCNEQLKKLAGNATIKEMKQMRASGDITNLARKIIDYDNLIKVRGGSYFEKNGGCRPLWFNYAGTTEDDWFGYMNSAQRAELRELLKGGDVGWFLNQQKLDELMLKAFNGLPLETKKQLVKLYDA